MLVLNKNILTIGGNRLEGGPLTPPEPPGPTFDEVTIGTQTWLAKNLAIDDGGPGIAIVDNVTANGVNFGTQYYYTWDAAVRVANSISGWHLPTGDEFVVLINYAGGDNVAGGKLKSTSGWNRNNGTDDYGFTLLPVGYYNSGISNVGSISLIWTSTEMNANAAYNIKITSSDQMLLITTSSNNKQYGYSVRLVKDT